MSETAFPPDFRFGTATSAHQIEGGQDNDWSAWEQLGRIKHGEQSGLSCDGWNRWSEDLKLARALKTNAYRFSVEWSRIEPRPGEWNLAALERYRRMVDTMEQLGLEPWLTLHHFTNPQWFSRSGGWLREDAGATFARYAEQVARVFPDVSHWCTINEPEVLTELGYLAGYWPPEKKSLRAALRVRKNLLLAHQRAADVLHRTIPRANVGLANNLVLFEPRRPWSPLDRLAATLSDRWHNRWFLDHAQGTIDFVGLNYYTRTRVGAGFGQPGNFMQASVPKGAPVSDMGWEIFPEGLGTMIDFAAQYHKPIYITENGVADADDSRRTQFIRDHLAVLLQKIQEGRDIRGYFHWSLMDNFEWREGFSPRFGLCAVDFKTQQRTLRPSGIYYSNICRTNTLTVGD